MGIVVAYSPKRLDLGYSGFIELLKWSKLQSQPRHVRQNNVEV